MSHQEKKEKIIITDLCNYAMPFIRYEIGDLGIPTDEKCSCGRNLPLIKSIKGRILDSIITPEGKIITGEFFPSLFADYNLKGIEEYQIIQKKRNKILIKIVKSKNYKEDYLNHYLQLIKSNVGLEMTIEVDFVDKITPNASGKRRPVISELKNF